MIFGDVVGRYCGDCLVDGLVRVIMSCGIDCDYGWYWDVGEGKNLMMCFY